MSVFLKIQSFGRTGKKPGHLTGDVCAIPPASPDRVQLKACHQPVLAIFASLWFCFVWIGGINAQYNTAFIRYEEMRRGVSVNLDFDAGSNGMNNHMMNKLIYGGYIDNESKDESSRYLKGINNFGVNLVYDVHAFLKVNEKVDMLVGVKNQEIVNATYTYDFYKLMFYGNDLYKGRTANLAGSNVNALRFQEVKVGFIRHHFDSIAKIGASVSLLKGEQLFYVKANKNSSLFTSGDGSQIIFNSNFSMALSDTNQKGLGAFNGIGASADIFFETPYKSKIGKRSVLLVNANNIGFIHWFKNSVQYSSDSTLSFSGYHVNNILDLKDSTLNRINRDSMVYSLTNARKEDFNVNIPTNLVIINKIYFGRQKFCLGTGFRHIFNANYIPYVFVEPEYKYQNVTFAIHAGYGGYVRLNVGAAVTWVNQNWYLRVGSNSIQGYILPRMSSGQGLFFSVAKRFR